MSAIGNAISRYIPLVGKKPKVDKREALAIVPVRHPLVDWQRQGEEVLLSVPLRDDRVARMIRRFLKNAPDRRQIALDTVGSDVWELCDGNRTIGAVVAAISKNHKLTRREAEVSVTTFLQTLAKRNLIGLMSPGGKKVVKRTR